MVDQKSKGRGPICKILVLLNAFTTLHTDRKLEMPLANSGSVSLQFVRYVKGIPNILNTFPVAKSPRSLYPNRIPFSSGRSCLGPHKDGDRRCLQALRTHTLCRNYSAEGRGRPPPLLKTFQLSAKHPRHRRGVLPHLYPQYLPPLCPVPKGGLL